MVFRCRIARGLWCAMIWQEGTPMISGFKEGVMLMPIQYGIGIWWMCSSIFRIVWLLCRLLVGLMLLINMESRYVSCFDFLHNLNNLIVWNSFLVSDHGDVRSFQNLSIIHNKSWSKINQKSRRKTIKQNYSGISEYSTFFISLAEAFFCDLNGDLILTGF